MEKQNRLGEYLKEISVERNLSLRNFADVIGLSHSYIAKLISGIDPRTKKKINPSISVLIQIADSLDVSRIDLLRRCGYLDKEKSDKVI